ncbi:hypothetical protein D918_00139 [Trichuris suis]|nr:hypothetical protein D918_00139 [Trichuris suis]
MDTTTTTTPTRSESNALSEPIRSKRTADSPACSSSSVESVPSGAAASHSVLMGSQPQPAPPMNPFFAAFVPPFMTGSGGFWQAQMPSAADYFYLASLFGGALPPPMNAPAPPGCPNGESFPDLLQQLSMAGQKSAAGTGKHFF